MVGQTRRAPAVAWASPRARKTVRTACAFCELSRSVCVANLPSFERGAVRVGLCSLKISILLEVFVHRRMRSWPLGDSWFLKSLTEQR